MCCNRNTLCVSIFSLCLAFVISGCKPSFPYYTTEGSQESREVHVHVSEDQVIEVPCGSGMGAGITAEDKMVPEGGEIVKEKDGVRVILTPKAGGAIFEVKEVFYNDQKCTAYEEVL